MNIWQFIYFYNCCRKHTTTEDISKICDGQLYESLMEKVAIATENSRKRHFERNKYNEGDIVQLTNWISKLSLRNHTPREKPKKGTNLQWTERRDIKGVITNGNHQICYVRIIEITNQIEDIEAQQEIWVPYDYVIKKNNFFIIFSIYLIIYIRIIFYRGRYLGRYMTEPPVMYPHLPKWGDTEGYMTEQSIIYLIKLIYSLISLNAIYFLEILLLLLLSPKYVIGFFMNIFGFKISLNIFVCSSHILKLLLGSWKLIFGLFYL